MADQVGTDIKGRKRTGMFVEQGQTSGPAYGADPEITAYGVAGVEAKQIQK